MRPVIRGAFLSVAACGLAAFVAVAEAAEAEPWPEIVEIRLTGNEKTSDKVILRELDLAPGDPADPAAIEAGRQAVQDLGLFREVQATTHNAPEGVVLELTMREKYHLLVLPRIDASSDRDYSYGAQLRWSNVWGLNHRLNLIVATGEYPEERDRREETSARVSYNAPYIFDSPYDLSVRAQRLERVTPVIDPVTSAVTDDEFDETFDRFEFHVARDLRQGRPRSGWILGGGMSWLRQETAGELAPPPDGQALALVGTADYDAMRLHVYSETGRRFNARIEAASEGVVSDYDSTRSTASYFQSRAFGSTPHQTLHLLGGAGVVTGGTGRRNEFSLGGSGRMRGYESDFLEGDYFYYGSLEYLRPIRWDWLRVVGFVEVGGTGDDREGLRDGSPYADIGLGVRIRLTWFVDVEIELGWAYPLRGGGGANFFAGGN